MKRIIAFHPSACYALLCAFFAHPNGQIFGHKHRSKMASPRYVFAHGSSNGRNGKRHACKFCTENLVGENGLTNRNWILGMVFGPYEFEYVESAHRNVKIVYRNFQLGIDAAFLGSVFCYSFERYPMLWPQNVGWQGHSRRPAFAVWQRRMRKMLRDVPFLWNEKPRPWIGCQERTLVPAGIEAILRREVQAWKSAKK